MKEYIVHLTKPSELKLILAIDLEDAFDLISERFSGERIGKIEEVKPEEENLPDEHL